MEFIVVLAIIGMLIGLVLPAVQAGRDAANKQKEPAKMPYVDDTPEKMPYLEE